MVKITSSKSPSDPLTDSSAVCGKASCSKPVTGSSGGMQCDLCSSWFHEACTGLDRQQYTLLQNSDNLPYNCPGCVGHKAYRLVPNDEFETLVNRVGTLLSLFSSLEGKVDQIVVSLERAGLRTSVRSDDCINSTVSKDPPTLEAVPEDDKHTDVILNSVVSGEVVQTSVSAKAKRRKIKKSISTTKPKLREVTVGSVDTPSPETKAENPSTSLPKSFSCAPAVPTKEDMNSSTAPATATVTRAVNTPRRSDAFTDSSVIFRNISESSATLPKDRMLDDLHWFKLCVSKLLPPGFPGVTVRKLTRLGNIS
ncbi:unnamed protein product, partial [Dicrocoelium dendriticum]